MGQMKVIAINGSPRKGGNTESAIKIMADELAKRGIETETVNIGAKAVHGCIACNYCAEHGLCVFKDDDVNETAGKISEADGFILACPTYYAGIPGTMKSFLDRLFYSAGDKFRHKAACAAVVVRRSGGVDVFHQLNNYLDLAETLRPPSQYWVVGHGCDKAELDADPEGVQTLKRSARGLAWVMELLKSGKDKVEAPESEERIFTNFVR